MFGTGQQTIIMRTKSPPRTSNRELKQRRFERCTSTGNEVFFILKHLDATKLVFLSVVTIL